MEQADVSTYVCMVPRRSISLTVFISNELYDIKDELQSTDSHVENVNFVQNFIVQEKSSFEDEGMTVEAFGYVVTGRNRSGKLLLPVTEHRTR